MKKALLLLAVFFCFGVLIFSNYFEQNPDFSHFFNGEPFNEWQEEMNDANFDEPLYHIINGLEPFKIGDRFNSFSGTMNLMRDAFDSVSSFFDNLQGDNNVPVWEFIGGFILLLIDAFIGFVGLLAVAIDSFLVLVAIPLNLFRVVW